MAYEVPKIWQHSDIPTAADLQKYSDSLDALYALIGDDQIEVAVLGIEDPNKSTIVHQHRWLHYMNSGTMSDPSGDEEKTLALSATGLAVLDLDTVPWLFYGALYEVRGCNFAAEHRDP